MIRVSELKLPVTGNQKALEKKLAKALRVPVEEIKAYRIFKRSLDARKKDNIHYAYVVDAEVKNENKILEKNKDKHISKTPDLAYHLPKGENRPTKRPVVVGFGPAGMFAALLLAEMGLKPIVLERGGDVDSRKQAVDTFWQTGKLDVESNVQFGEGGAGTFSDGKLTTRIGDELCGFVTEVFLQHGAPAEIAWKQKPHVGTDLLRGVITSIRREIEALGGEVHFNTALTGFEQKNGRLTGIFTTGGTFPCEALVFAVGHSARDTFGMLMDSGLVLECKPFSVGFRAEHLQSEIEKSLYHEAAGHPALPRGEYQLSQHVGDRCVYTFCMCPGGQVVASASETGHVVTNGMSYHARDGKNANAALAVSVDPKDYDDGTPFGGVALQRRIEHAAYTQTGTYRAPCQKGGDFLNGKPTRKLGAVKPSYPIGVELGEAAACLPDFAQTMLRDSLPYFGRKIRGYDTADALLTGPETRTSSPVRMTRGEDLFGLGCSGIIPCGEGAGYAGGIMSAAVDGIRAAFRIMGEFAN